MRHTWIVVVLALASHAAVAGNRCRSSTEMGYERCGRGVPSVWLELGATAMRYTPDRIDQNAAQYHFATTDTAALSATGWRFRGTVDVQDDWYTGLEFDYAQFGGPGLTANWIDRGTVMTMSVATRGDIVQAKLPLGKRAVAGRLAFGAELAPGLQVATFTTTDIPNYVEPWIQSWFVLEAHAKLDAWLTSRTTLGLEASADLLHSGHIQAALLFGFHLAPR